jgi:hypothetical protein
MSFMKSTYRELVRQGFGFTSLNNSQGACSLWRKVIRKLDKYGGFIMFFEV